MSTPEVPDVGHDDGVSVTDARVKSRTPSMNRRRFPDVSNAHA
jgi:hypothetical protein